MLPNDLERTAKTFPTCLGYVLPNDQSEASNASHRERVITVTGHHGLQGGSLSTCYPDRVAPLVAAAKTEAEIHRILAGETNALRRKMAKAISDAGY